MEEDSLLNENEITKTKRLKLYMGSLFPIDKNMLMNLDLKKIDIDRNQAFVYKEDAHREIFSAILLAIGRSTNKKPSWCKITLNELVDYSFSPDRKPVPKYLERDILFITHATPTRENKIYGPVLDQVVEERKTFGKKTYLFYKGIASQYKGLKSNSIVDIVDLNTPNERTKRNEVI